MSDPQAWREGLNEETLAGYDAILQIIRREVGERFTVLHVIATLQILKVEPFGTHTVSLDSRPNSLIAWNASEALTFMIMGLGKDPMIGGGACNRDKYPRTFHSELPIGRPGAKDFATPHWVPIEYRFRNAPRVPK